MSSVPESFEQIGIRIWGAFNPAIITPDWLLAKHLIDEADREYATEEGRDRVLVTSVFAGGRYRWVDLEASRESLRLDSTPETETGQRIRELAIGLLAALPETPVARVDFSYHSFVRTGTDGWDRLADCVAPTLPLADTLPGLRLETLVHRTDRDDGYIELMIEPSRMDGFDLFIEFERVWEISEPPGVDAELAIRVLDKEWEATEEEAAAVVRHLVGIK